jgi:hypothetical protein
MISGMGDLRSGRTGAVVAPRRTDPHRWTVGLTRAAIVAAAAAASVAVFARRMTRWGATDDEVIRPLPGDDIIPGSQPSVTNAVTIDAPPEQVWPWIVQIGRGRAGFYTYTLA